MAMDKLFKGILQVSQSSFSQMSDDNKKGYIIFVRKDTSKLDGDAEVWFGTRRYGNVEATRLAEIESSIESLGGRVDAIETTLGDFTAQLTGDLKTVAAVVANHESRLDTAEGKITAIETLLGEGGEIRDEINDIRDFAQMVNDRVDSVVNDIIGEISGGTTVAHEIARVEGLANTAQSAADAAQDGVDAIVADYLKSTDKTELEDKITAAETAAKEVATVFNTAMDSRMTTVEGKVADLEAIDHEQLMSDAINAWAQAESNDQTVNTFKELVDYAATHKTEFTEIYGEVQGMKTSKADATALSQEVDDRKAADNELRGAINAINESLTEGTVFEAIEGAQNAADAAQEDVKALEKIVGSGFNETSTVASQLAEVKATADSAIQSVVSGSDYITVTSIPTDDADYPGGPNAVLNIEVCTNFEESGNINHNEVADALAIKSYVDSQISINAIYYGGDDVE